MSNFQKYYATAKLRNYPSFRKRNIILSFIKSKERYKPKIFLYSKILPLKSSSYHSRLFTAKIRQPTSQESEASQVLRRRNVVFRSLCQRLSNHKTTGKRIFSFAEFPPNPRDRPPPRGVGGQVIRCLRIIGAPFVLMAE